MIHIFFTYLIRVKHFKFAVVISIGQKLKQKKKKTKRKKHRKRTEKQNFPALGESVRCGNKAFIEARNFLLLIFASSSPLIKSKPVLTDV